MAELITLLPQPRHESRAYVRKDVQPEAPAPVKATPEPPAYGQRDGWLPKTEDDFGDGGAFPEIHIFQYPLGMGRRDSNAVARASKALSLQVDAEGKPTFDLVVRQNVRKDQVVFSQYKDLVEKDATESQLARPSLEEEQKATERTKAALGQIVSAKLAAAQPTHVKGTKQDEPTFIRYTPTQQGDQYNSGAGQRIIQLREAPVDPLEPPRFTHKKTPAGPPSPPVPVLHSPPRKVTAADMQNWKIPPCISNWKNVKGYTIPLDKRLAADGRGLQDVTINDKFAKLAESLGVAERQARTEIEARAQLTRTVARKQKEQKEAELRNLAAQARAAGGHRGMAAPESAESSTTATTSTTGEINEDLDDEGESGSGEGQSSSNKGSRGGGRSKETDDDLERRDQREEMRRDFKRELRRDLRMEKMSDEKKQNKTFAGRDKERDVSEKIALGQKTAAGKDTLFDQRLFNQQEGLSQGFGADDDYNSYDKPLFKGSSANFIYRPKPNTGELLGDEDQADKETASGGKVNKILEKSAGGERAPRAPDRGFRGTETAGPNASQRQKPVEFEKQTDDPFGLGDFLKDSKDGKKRKANALDGIGSKGHMMASAGGASFGSSDDSRHSKRMEFREAGSDDGEDRSSKRQRR